jgi:hypothetical protein
MISPVNVLSFGAPKLKVAKTRVATMLTAAFIVFLLKTTSEFYPGNLPADLKISPAAVVHPNSTTIKTPTAALSA